MQWNDIQNGSSFIFGSITYLKTDDKFAYDHSHKNYISRDYFKGRELHKSVNRLAVNFALADVASSHAAGALYDAGKFEFNSVPPVSTAAWKRADWLRYIATNGFFFLSHTPTKEEELAKPKLMLYTFTLISDATDSAVGIISTFAYDDDSAIKYARNRLEVEYGDEADDIPFSCFERFSRRAIEEGLTVDFLHTEG